MKNSIKSKLAIAKEALEEIADPISFMQKRAEAEGSQIDGRMAIALSGDPNFLKAIARNTLKKLARDMLKKLK